MQDDYYIELLNKQLAGEIEPAEQQQLDDWLADSAEHRAEAAAYKEAWRLGGQFTADVDLDTEADFALLQQRIAAEEPEKGATVRRMRGRRPWLQVAAALVFLLATTWVIRNYTGLISGQQIVQTRKDIQEITLPDGSSIWLNQASKLTYPESFTAGERRVKLEGEAFFDIQRNPNWPFIVETTSSEVRVLGTSFNVRHYAAEPFVEVQVRTGKVRMEMRGNGDALELVANEKGYYDGITKALIKQTDESLNALAWQSGLLRFDGQTLEKVLSTVERQYGIQIELANQALNNCAFTNRFQNKSAEEVLDVIAGVFQMKVEKTGPNNYRLLGGSC